MRVRWTPPARDDVARIRAYLKKRNPQAAKRIAGAIKQASRHIQHHPYSGREARFAGAQEFVVPRTTYILLYDVLDDYLDIIAIVDGRMEWKEGEPPPRPATDW